MTDFDITRNIDTLTVEIGGPPVDIGGPRTIINVVSGGEDGEWASKTDLTEGLATKSEADHDHAGTYVTPAELNAALADIETPADGVTEAELATALAGKADTDHAHADYLTSADLPEPVDLTNYATKAELDGKADAAHTHAGYLTNADLPDLSGFATKDELTTGLGTKAATEHDHAGTYVTPAELDAALAGVEAPDGGVTQEALDAALAGKADTQHTHAEYLTSADLPDPVDLSGYATKAELGGKAEAGHDHAGTYVTPAELSTALDALDVPEDAVTEAELTTALAGKADTGHTHADYLTSADLPDLSGFATKSELAGKAEADHTHAGTYVTPTELDAALADFEAPEGGVSQATLDAAIEGKMHYVGSTDNRFVHVAFPDVAIGAVAQTSTDGVLRLKVHTNSWLGIANYYDDFALKNRVTALEDAPVAFAVVEHGADASTARPSATKVEWHGSVAPTNATTWDTWIGGTEA